MNCSPEGCSRSLELGDAGYATPAALVLALALSLVAVAMVERSVMMLRLVRADLRRVGVEYLLDGAHLVAAATVVRAGDGGPYRWAVPMDGGFAEALAESEAAKLDPARGADLPDSVFLAMGVADIAALKGRLRAAADTPFADVPSFDAAPLWRECSASLISSLGRRTHGGAAAPSEPRQQPETPDWRVGEIWRLRVTTAAGWRDDRIVRFTGDARRPVAVVRRELSRSDGGQGRCDLVMATAA